MNVMGVKARRRKMLTRAHGLREGGIVKLHIVNFEHVYEQLETISAEFYFRE